MKSSATGVQSEQWSSVVQWLWGCPGLGGIQLCHLLPVWPWTRCCTSASHCFRISKMETATLEGTLWGTGRMSGRCAHRRYCNHSYFGPSLARAMRGYTVGTLSSSLFPFRKVPWNPKLQWLVPSFPGWCLTNRPSFPFAMMDFNMAAFGDM